MEQQKEKGCRDEICIMVLPVASDLGLLALLLQVCLASTAELGCDSLSSRIFIWNKVLRGNYLMQSLEPLSA